jgi:4-hydroxyphenylacetate 3-monooxygenase
MRTGAEYRKALRDGRRVWIMGEGWAEDVTTHPATGAMVDEYSAWYDRHLDPEWREILLSPQMANGELLPWASVAPRSSADLVGMGRSFAKTIFLSAGNITHTPAYGNLIALGVLTAAQSGDAPAEHIAAAAAYRDDIARSGRFLTYCGGAPIIGQRLRPDPADRVALKLIRETDAGIVISGRLGMHTSPAYAEDVYVGALSRLEIDGRPVSFIVPVNAPGVIVLCRKRATRDQNPFVSPLSSRFDELDGQMWLDDVLIPWERLFFVDPTRRRSRVGCAGITFTAGSPRRNSPWVWRWR